MSAVDTVTPTVCVCMITYNHERFIAQAIESVLTQEISFPMELIIGEDCSTDGTRAIVIEYAQRDPDRIHLHLNERNLGVIPNFVATLKACRGKYIALLEGDDYWTDPFKLQKQVDFLEANPDYVLCYHDAIIIDGDGQVIGGSLVSNKFKRNLSADELAKHSTVIPTAAACFHNILSEIPFEFFEVPAGDTFLFSVLGLNGKAGYLGNEIKPARYRSHSGGVWSSLKPGVAFSQAAKTFYMLGQYYYRIDQQNLAEHYMVKHLYCAGAANYWQGDKVQARRQMLSALRRCMWSRETWRLFLSFEIFGTGQLRRKLARCKKHLKTGYARVLRGTSS